MANVVSLKDALVAIASVSAVLWTGGLIVLQLRHDARSAQAADRPQTEAIKGAMACIAFGMLAPLFILFLPDTAIRVVAGLFSVFYLWYTWNEAWSAVCAFREQNWGVVIPNLGFFAPTAAMLIVTVFASPIAVAWVSALLVFFGYFLLSISINALGRP